MSVRKNDFSHGAIEGAVNLPLEKIEAGETAILKKRISLFICTAMWVKTAVMQLKILEGRWVYDCQFRGWLPRMVKTSAHARDNGGRFKKRAHGAD